MTDEQYLMELYRQADNHLYTGMPGESRGLRLAADIFKANRPGSIPVVDAARLVESCEVEADVPLVA